MKYKILGVRWIGSRSRQLGVVAFETDKDEWMATIGRVKDNHSEEYSMQDIAGWGAKE